MTITINMTSLLCLLLPTLSICSTISASTAPVASYSGYTYAGCVTDNIGGARVLSSLLTSGVSMNNELCVSACSKKAFKYAGIEYATQCWCGASPKYLTTAKACTMTCPGNKLEYCGGSNALNFYATRTVSVSIVGASTTSTTSTSSASISKPATPSTTSSIPSSTSSKITSSSSKVTVTSSSSSSLSSSSSSSSSKSPSASSSTISTTPSASSSFPSSSSSLSSSSRSSSAASLSSILTNSGSTSLSPSSSVSSTGFPTLSLSSTTSTTVNATSSIVSPSATPLASDNFASTVLILGVTQDDIDTASSVLNGYGIPFEGHLVPMYNFILPTLNKSDSNGNNIGNYGLLVVQGQVAQDYGSLGWQSSLNTSQWQQLYDYQTEFGVRMVHLSVFPGSVFGAATVDPNGGGCCDANDDQNVTILTAAMSRFPNAGLRDTAPLSLSGLWHYPAIITDTNLTETTPFIQFGTNNAFQSPSVGGVINTYATRQQMAFFTSFGTWSPTSTFLSHIWIQWGTRGLYSGMRRAMLGTQIDDLLLETEVYTSPNVTYRLTTTDLNNHVAYTNSLNTRLVKTNPGSLHFLEFGFNGNGAVLEGQLIDGLKNTDICNIDPINYDTPYSETALEFIKPLNSSSDFWPTTPATFRYSSACVSLDPITAWLMIPSNRDNFAYVTHTYTHLSLNNATYHDTSREISWNQLFGNLTSLSSAKWFSGGGLIPPAITGMHNGDALRAFSDNGLHNAVGDNTRPVLRSPYNVMWPVITNVSENGFDGFQITPRFATRIYYNCDSVYCTVTEWINTSAGVSGDVQTLLSLEKASTSNQLLGLYHDPYMFHQANLRTTVNATLVNGSLQTLSLIQIWIETQIAEFRRLVTWPLITLKHDDIAASFKARMIRDSCNPNIAMIVKNGQITGFQVTTTGNICATVVPVTVPGSVTNTQGFKTEHLGNDPLTIWVQMSGSPVTFTLTSSITLSTY